jgi:hypothetical protein
MDGEVLYHHAGNICWVRQKRAEKAHSAKLDRISQSVVSAPVRSDFDSISIVQEEIFRQLRGCRVSVIAAIPSGLLRRKKVYGHLSGVSK